MFVGVVEFDLLLGDVRSLKQKRTVVRPIVAELKRLDVAVSEAGHLDLYRRAAIGVATVAPDAGRCGDTLDRCEQMLSRRPEIEILSVRRRLYGDDD